MTEQKICWNCKHRIRSACSYKNIVCYNPLAEAEFKPDFHIGQPVTPRDTDASEFRCWTARGKQPINPSGNYET